MLFYHNSIHLVAILDQYNITLKSFMLQSEQLPCEKQALSRNSEAAAVAQAFHPETQPSLPMRTETNNRQAWICEWHPFANTPESL